MTPIEEYWDDIRLKPRRAKYLQLHPYEVAPLIDWGKGLSSTSRPTFKVIPGGNSQSVMRLVANEFPQEIVILGSGFCDSEDSVGQLMSTVRRMRVPAKFRVRENLSFRPLHPGSNPLGWDILWCLVAHRDIVLSSYLKDLVGKKSSRLTEFYKALVEIRFEAKERGSLPTIEENVVALGRWVDGGYAKEGAALTSLKLKTGIKGDVGAEERLDLLLFILNLAKDNQLLEDFMVFFEGMEGLSKKGAEGLNEIILALDRWVPVGCPLNLLLGWRGSKEDRIRLKTLHPRLLVRFREGSSWTSRSKETP
jgi:hypothetical protein